MLLNLKILTLLNFYLSSCSVLGQSWPSCGVQAGTSATLSLHEQLCSWAGCPASKLWEIFIFLCRGNVEEGSGGGARGLPWHVGRCHLPAWLWRSHGAPRPLALWMASLLRSALHQYEELWAGDKRAGRRKGQGEKASDKHAYPWTTNEITRNNVRPLLLLLDLLTASVPQWDSLQSQSFFWIIVFKRSLTSRRVVGIWPHRWSQASSAALLGGQLLLLYS